MEIKKGLVQWNGRNDIPCSYIDMEDGSRYYIKQDLSNGNHIVTTSLLEAVDPMAKVENTGLLSVNGDMIIPSNNSSIKVLGDNLLLVVPSEAVSDSVKEANNLRLDPLAATRLVSTPAQIKEKINAKMSPEGRYELNDQFKEGTLYDANGNNLLNNDYYSFVAKDKDKLYLAKNNLDTDVKEFSISDGKIVEEVKEEVPVTEIEVPTTEVTTEVVENVGEGIVPIVEGTNEVIPSEENSDLGEEITIPDVDADFSFDVEKETEAQEVDSSDDVVIDDKDDYLHEAEFDRMSKSMEEKNENITKEMQDIEEYRFDDSKVKVDSIDNIEEDSDDIEEVDDYQEETTDTTMEDATKTISDLIQKYTAKDSELNEALEREERLKATNDIYKKKIKAQEQKISLITSKNRDLMNSNAQNEAKIESLTMALDLQKRKSEEQRRTITEQTREIARLNSQVAGKEELARALESARALIEDNESYSDEDSYYKVA